MPSPGGPRWLRRGLVAVTVLLLALGGTVAFVLLHAPGNVSHPNLEFTAPPSTAAAPPPKPKPKPKRAAVDNFLWPLYGYNDARTRALAPSRALAPPLHVGWRYDEGGLLEFPPVIYHGTLYLLDDYGSARAVDARNGHVLWSRHVGTLAAASPAVDVADHLVMMPILSMNPGPDGHAPPPGNGRFVALSMRTGRTAWSHPVAAGSESSPIVSRRLVYFGDQGGTVYALRARDGHVKWTYHASGAVKGGPALVGRTLYFGDYAGRAYALDALNGHQIWAVGTSGTQFGFGSGNFYSTPAVAFGRVYLGNTDGRVYSFGARDGALAWATATGAYVYSSAAVQVTPGLGPTVYIGSYDGNFYAFNAQSGAIRWTHNAGGRISGSPTIVGDVVYYSDLGSKTSAGLDVRTGRQVFSFHDGLFSPVIADDHAIYLVGRQTIYELLPGARKRTAVPPRSRHPTGSHAKPQSRSRTASQAPRRRIASRRNR